MVAKINGGVVVLLAGVLMNLVRGEMMTKDLWTLDESSNLLERRRMSSRSFRSSRMEQMKDVSLFEFSMEVASSLGSGDLISFQVPPSAKLKKKAAVGRAADPPPVQKSCKLIEGIVGVPRNITPGLKLFTCFPSKFEQFHLIINTEKENGIFGTFFDAERSSFYIDPAFEDGETYMIYNYKSMIPDKDDVLNEGVDYVIPNETDYLVNRALSTETPRLRKLQVGQPNAIRLRFVILVTPETSADLGGTVASVSADLIAVLSRTNGIISRDLGIMLELIDGFERAFCFDRNSAPCSEVINNPNQRTLNGDHLNRLGISADQYDLGHSFHQSLSGGVANVDIVCNSNPMYKAGGTSDYSGRAFSTPDAFVVSMFAHELGHQLGALHSWRDCGQYQSSFTERDGVEPGSGSTIMSYVGTCASANNIQRGTDPYYNNLSQKYMRDSVQNQVSRNSNCGRIQSISRTVPTASSPGKCIIPSGNKFLLQGDSTSSLNDNRFASWDRIDTGAESVTDANQGRFRSYKPSRQRERFFPNLHFVNFEIYPRAENLPTGADTMKFRFTERRDYLTDAHLDSFDQSIMGDFTSSDTDVEFQVLGKLQITEPASGGEIPVNEPFVVSWSPGDIPNLSPDGKVQILFAQNTMTSIRNLADFDSETDLDALDWKLLGETNVADGSACVSLPEISGNLNSIDGNLLIKSSVNQDSGAGINDASNCFAIDISTSIGVFQQSKSSRKRNLQTCSQVITPSPTNPPTPAQTNPPVTTTNPPVPSTTPSVPSTSPPSVSSPTSEPADSFLGFDVELLFSLMALVGLIGLMVAAVVFRKMKSKRSTRRPNTSFQYGGNTASSMPPKSEMTPGGFLGTSSRKRGFSLTNEHFGKQATRNELEKKPSNLLKKLGSLKFSFKKNDYANNDEVAVTEGPRIQVQPSSSRVSRAFGVFSGGSKQPASSSQNLMKNSGRNPVASKKPKTNFTAAQKPQFNFAATSQTPTQKSNMKPDDSQIAKKKFKSWNPPKSSPSSLNSTANSPLKQSNQFNFATSKKMFQDPALSRSKGSSNNGNSSKFKSSITGGNGSMNSKGFTGYKSKPKKSNAPPKSQDSQLTGFAAIRAKFDKNDI